MKGRKKRYANGEVKTERYIILDYESMNDDGLHVPN